MAYKIGDDCISCGSCASTCPVEAISEGSEHGRPLSADGFLLRGAFCY